MAPQLDQPKLKGYELNDLEKYAKNLKKFYDQFEDTSSMAVQSESTNKMSDTNFNASMSSTAKQRSPLFQMNDLKKQLKS